ncbi:MAG: hypothetical protein JOZ19_10355 [Rubrobacter sp.]|nr:hypothetical protein [Rubrobacter sp.]
MTENQHRRQEFARGLQNELAKLWREGGDRIDRIGVEEIGRRFRLDQDEAREAFVALRGDVWEGEFIEANEEPGWEAVVLKDVPSSGPPEETPI